MKVQSNIKLRILHKRILMLQKWNFKFASNANINIRSMKYIYHLLYMLEKLSFMDNRILKYRFHEERALILIILYWLGLKHIFNIIQQCFTCIIIWTNLAQVQQVHENCWTIYEIPHRIDIGWHEKHYWTYVSKCCKLRQQSIIYQCCDINI